MQIIIFQNEIEKAIRDYVQSKLSMEISKDIQIDLSATRGAEGFKAILDTDPVTKPMAQERKRRKSVKAHDPKPESIVEEIVPSIKNNQLTSIGKSNKAAEIVAPKHSTIRNSIFGSSKN